MRTLLRYVAISKICSNSIFAQKSLHKKPLNACVCAGVGRKWRKDGWQMNKGKSGQEKNTDCPMVAGSWRSRFWSTLRVHSLRRWPVYSTSAINSTHTINTASIQARCDADKIAIFLRKAHPHKEQSHNSSQQYCQEPNWILEVKTCSSSKDTEKLFLDIFQQQSLKEFYFIRGLTHIIP